MPSREVSRCFALMANNDTSTATCRFRQGKKTKAGKIISSPVISFDKGKTTENIHLLGTITLEKGVHMEIWQTRSFVPSMQLEDVWNIPLFDDLATFPIIFRIIATDAKLLPTVGKARKLLAARIQSSSSIITDDEEYETTRPNEDYTDDEDDEDDAEDDEDDDDIEGDDTEEDEEDEEDDDEGEENDVDDDDEEEEEDEDGNEDDIANDEDY